MPARNSSLSRFFQMTQMPVTKYISFWLKSALLSLQHVCLERRFLAPVYLLFLFGLDLFYVLLYDKTFFCFLAFNMVYSLR